MKRVAPQRNQNRNTAVLIVVTVALVSIVTGLGSMVTDPLLEGPGYVGTAQTAAGFSAVIVGFFLLATAWGMRQGFRLAYLVALFLIVLSTIHGVVQARPVSVPLVILSMVAIVSLVRRRRREFSRPVALSETQIGALLAIGAVVAYGTVGAYVLRTDIDGVDGLLDGLYFTLVTASTVGYGDVYATSITGRLFAITLILLGPASIVAIGGSLFAPALESRLGRAGTRARTDRVSRGERVVLLADAPLGGRVVDTLAEQASVVVVTPDEDWARELETGGIDVRVADPADEAVLDGATFEEAIAVVVARDSETTPYTVHAARRVDADARIVAVTSDGRDATLAELGADVTIDPAGLLARTATRAALGQPTVSSP